MAQADEAVDLNSLENVAYHLQDTRELYYAKVVREAVAEIKRLRAAATGEAADA